MAKKSWHLDRRTFIKGVGAACMLPYLESMGMGTITKFADSLVPKRLCFMYIPNGVGIYKKKDPLYKDWNWFPVEEGKNFQFTKTLEGLAPHRDELSILGGLSHPKSRQLLGHIAGDTWLTAGDLRGSDYKNNISVDQAAAQQLQKHTRFPSLVLSSDGGVGYKSRAATLSFDAIGKAIPAEHKQRAIFERYFAPNNGGTTAERKKSLQQGKKIVDLVLEDSNNLKRRLGTNDTQKLDEYMSSLNSVEEQIKRNEKWLDVPFKEVDSSGINMDALANIDPQAYLRSMMDLMVIGYQTDMTRVMTYMLAREDGMGFGDNFPKIALGLNGHHGLTHDKTTGHLERQSKYDQWLVNNFAYFLDRMKNTNDEYGSLLDNTLVLYGSSCSSTHNANNCPLILAGGRKLGANHGSYTVFDPKETHMSNLFVSMLNKVGVATESFADSTGVLPHNII